MNAKIATRRATLLLLLVTLCAGVVAAQTTSFTYQGKLSDGGTAANGNYDLQFALFDSPAGGNQVGATQALNTVAVSSGIFSVSLDFGAGVFPGNSRFLEISARISGGGAFTTLAPRQQISSTPYAIRSLNATAADTATNATTATTATNATQLGGVAANQYVQTNDSRLSDARTPAAGSSNYIQNSANPQASANFNVGGNGTAGGTLSATIVNAATQYNLGGSRVLIVEGFNNTNTFVGVTAGGANTTGHSNSFFGRAAGAANTSGGENSFFGTAAGGANMTGFRNSFFGRWAGIANIGAHNSFFGTSAGSANTEGFGNSFFGSAAGDSNSSGDNNTVIGYSADVASGNLTNATAIGALASVSQSNSLVLGSINGINAATADTNVGIGTTAPVARLHIRVTAGNILMGDAGCSSSFNGIGFGSTLSGCANYSLLGNGTDTIINRPTGGAMLFRENNTTQMSIAPGGVVSVITLGSGGGTSLCRNASNQISTCSSSRRYKEQIFGFDGGLNLLSRLRPVQFVWKADQQPDLGLVAEEVADVEPLLVIHNDKGEIEGVKYSHLNVVFINAIKEQQSQLQQQQQAAKQQQAQIEALRLANTALSARLRSVESIMRRAAAPRRRH